MMRIQALLLGFVALWGTAMASAASLKDLRDEGRLKTGVVVETDAPLYQRAPVVIADRTAQKRCSPREQQSACDERVVTESRPR